MKILVTGGSGYIGSVTVSNLLERGHDVTVFDNLLYGHKDAVSCPLIAGDLLDKDFLRESLDKKNFDAVIHFAAYALAGESMITPYKYFSNNIQGGLNLLEVMKAKKIRHIIFSSTCSVYGTPQKLPVNEAEEKNPENVYGESKLAFEKILQWYDKIYGLKHISLRYFNAAGASLDGKLGENHNPETHIIPNAIKAAINRNQFNLYGNDYPTEDGTCIRDYIHVEDLAEAHVLALKKLTNINKSDVYNIGSGFGFSNLQIINKVNEITKQNLNVVVKQRRQGDPGIVYADITKAKKILKFNPKYSDLDTIVKTAYNWHKSNNG